MHRRLLKFITRLRDRGLPISPREHLDALAALDHVRWLDRTAFREALRATLVKRQDHAAAFEEEFAAFFAPPPLPATHRAGKVGRGGKRERGQHRAHTGQEGQRRPGSSVGEPRPTGKPAGYRGHQHSDTPASSPAGRGGEPQEEGEARRVTFRGTRPPTVTRSVQELSRTDLHRLTEAEQRELRRQVRLAARRVASRLSRRHKHSRRGRPDLKRTLRTSLQFGGVPFVLAHKARRLARAEVVVLCDVSGSVVRASELVLEFLRALTEARAIVRVFAFTNRAAEITAALAAGAANLPKAAADAGVDLHAFSDFGHACHDLATRCPGLVTRRTTLLVIGDARNNYGDPLAWAFEDLAAPARRVLWLVPEARQRWNTGDSQLAAYAPLCDVVAECHTLEHLLRALQRL